jgi:hypothetical protein
MENGVMTPLTCATNDVSQIQKIEAQILFTSKMDENKKRIEALLNLIQSSRGNYQRLLELIDQVSVLLLREVERERREQLEEDLESNTIEPPGEPPCLEIDENSKGLLNVQIPSNQLHDMFFDCDGVIDFFNRCIDYISDNIVKQESVLKFFKLKCYVQLKVTFEFYHEKPHDPTFKTVKKSFYVDKPIQRKNLAQSPQEFKSIIIEQTREILLMINNFENNGSNWVIVKPVSFKIRLIKYAESFRRAKGFIPTPSWLHGRRAIINIKNDDDNCFFKCIYRHFNKDKHRHDYRDVKMEVVSKFFNDNNFNLSMFERGVDHK